jgi:UPF0042 nucleotide-binding protein
MTKGPKKLFIITGLSGAGKSQALKTFEDFGFFCVDNLPIALLPRFAELLRGSDDFGPVALGMDIREAKFVREFPRSLRLLKSKGVPRRVLFLEASEEVLLKRFSETRHRHPLGRKLLEAIREERKLLQNIKALADKVIDTSNLTLGELKETLSGLMELKSAEEMNLSVVSFGYKYGLPLDADVVMDVRFLPNPNYVLGLKAKTGLSPEVQAYLDRQQATGRFLRVFHSLIRKLLPLYIREGKSYLTVAVGCTGGRHRSVFVAHKLAETLREAGYAIKEFHRDIHQR